MAGPWEKYQRTTDDNAGPWTKYSPKEAPAPFDDIPSNPPASWTDNLRDPAAGLLKVGPTALKGVADIARLLSGDRVGTGLSGAMQGGMTAIDDLVGSQRLRDQKAQVSQALQDDAVGITDIPGVLMDNPRAALDMGVSTIGSMFLPVGVAGAAVKGASAIPRLAGLAPGAVATGATIGTGAAQNAAETFADTDGQPLSDRYQGAGISAAASLVLGKLLGGGAEGVVARRLAGEAGLRGAATIAKSAAKTGAKEFAQEFGEEGANTIGKQVGGNESIDLTDAGKQGMLGGILGLGLGAGADVATNVGNVGKGGIEREIAALIEQASNDIADTRPSAATVRNLFADLPEKQNVQDPRAPARAQAAPVEATAPEASNAAPAAGVPDAIGAGDVQAPRLMVDGLDVSKNTPETNTSEEPAQKTPEIEQVDVSLTNEGKTPVLQNRNRATPSSIAQMQSIAAQPDYGRLGFSRDFANGAPVVAGGQVAPEQLGRQDVAVASDGRRIPVQYAVVEASDVLPSNQADGTPNADYGNQAVQRIRAIAGNGRIAGLQQAYRKGTTPGYLNELAADTLHGVNPDAIRRMRAPVLVRMMPADQVSADIGDVSNTTGNLNLSAVEQANNDAQRVNLDALQFAEDGGITAEAVRQFVRAMPQAEQGGLIDTNGQPTKQAVDRINAAVFARAYGNDQLVRLFAQAQDPEARNVLSALAQVAPKMARLEGLGALDIRDVVTQAAEIAVNARREGKPMAQAAQQLDMAADPMVGVVLDLFAANARSVKPVVQALSNAADLAYTEATKPAEDMFGAVPRAGRADVINQLRPENERASQENLEQPAGRGPVQVDAGRAEAQPAAAADPAAAEAGRPAETEGLTSYTPEEVTQRLERLEQAEAERKKQDREAEQRQQADAERGDLALTGSDRAADANPNQGDIFSAPAEPEAPALAYTPASKIDTPTQGVLNNAKERKAQAFARLKRTRQQVKDGTANRLELLKAESAHKDAVRDVEAAEAQLERDANRQGLTTVREDGAAYGEQTQTPAFKRWFGDSKVVDSAGKPLVVYHGTTRDFSSFDSGAKRNLMGGDAQGLYFTVFPEDASNYAAYPKNGDSTGANVMPVYLSLQNPKVVDADTFEQAFISKAARDQLESQGFDGMMTTDKSEVIAFRPEQVKSATGNAGTFDPADPSIVREDGQAYNAEAPRRPFTDDKQLQLFLDSEPDPSQTGPAVDRARREAVAAVDDLRSTESILAQALSGDYAARQRTSLVGQKVSSAEDLAVLAQVYRDPRFETFRVVFTNDSGKVVSQVGLTSRLPSSTAAIMGDDMDGYLKELAATARNRGASRYYMLHNHPSGQANVSRADESITQAFASRTFGTDLQFRGHVVIDTNEYSVINGKGESTLFKKDFGQPAPYLAQEWADVKIGGPDDVMAMAKRLQVDWGAVTLIHTDAQFRVKAISTLPATVAGDVRKQVIRASLQVQGSQVFAVSRSPVALKRMSGFVRDAILVEDSGAVKSLAASGEMFGGEPFPTQRRTRVSPDTSPEFAYLRNVPATSVGQRAAESGDVEMTARATAASYNVNGIQPAPWTVPEPGAGDAFIRAIQNNKIDLKRLRDAVAAQYGQPAVQKDAYLAEELYHGKVAARVEALHKESVEPILAKIAVAGKNAGVTLDDVNQYLHARHAPERNAAMKAINPTMPNNDALSGMSNADAAKVMADFNASGKGRALDLIAKDVDQLLADNRAAMVADGLEDAGVIQAWESAYTNYVPLQRDVSSSGTPKGMGFSVRGPESKRAMGSNKEVVNILANIVAQAETTAIRAEKAKVGRTLLAMARQYPNADFWKVDVPPTKPRINKDTGLVERNAVDPMYQTADNVVMVKDFGVDHFIVFNKDSERAMEVAKAMRNLGIEPIGRVLQVVSKGTRFLASMLTQRNPVFWLTNFSRDIQGAMLNLEGTEAEGLQREVLGNVRSAFKGMHALVRKDGRGQWARYARDMMEAGGTTGYMQTFENSDRRMDDLKAEVAKMQQGKADPRRLGRQLLDFIDDYNDIIENAVRLSVFQAARDNGIATARAASIAKNITVNFNRKGNTTPLVNSLYMFFNASVQGTARLAQAVVTSKKAQAAVAGITAMGFLLDALNRAMSDDDEETGRNQYDLIPEFDKAKNWIIMNPMRPGEYVKIPLPLGPHVFHNAGRLVSDAIFRDDPRNLNEYGWAVANTLLDAFSPLGTASSLGQLVAPSVIDPVMQLTENKSFTGAPVFKSADRGFGPEDPAPAYTRYFESTPDLWKAASRLMNDVSGGDDVKPGKLNIEPDILKHVFYTLTGGPGRTLDQAVDSAQSEARGQETSVNRFPLASRFYGANDDKQRERVFYDDRKRVADTKTEFDYYVKNGRREDARKVAEELGDGDFQQGLRKMREFKGANTSIKKINAQIKKEMERQASGEDRAEQLKALRQRRVRVMSDAVREDE